VVHFSVAIVIYAIGALVSFVVVRIRRAADIIREIDVTIQVIINVVGTLCGRALDRVGTARAIRIPREVDEAVAVIVSGVITLGKRYIIPPETNACVATVLIPAQLHISCSGSERERGGIALTVPVV
jgi:uncharacterized membrane protein YjjP (DUF1212 family)